MPCRASTFACVWLYLTSRVGFQTDTCFHVCVCVCVYRYVERVDTPLAQARVMLASRNTSSGPLPPPPVYTGQINVHIRLGTWLVHACTVQPSSITAWQSERAHRFHRLRVCVRAECVVPDYLCGACTSTCTCVFTCGLCNMVWTVCWGDADRGLGIYRALRYVGSCPHVLCISLCARCCVSSLGSVKKCFHPGLRL